MTSILGIVLLFIIIIFMVEATVPKSEGEKVHSSPKDVFLHILMIGTLYVSTFMFSSLWFDYINFLFPDKLNYYYRGILDGILVGTSTLIVVFPVYLLTAWMLEREIKGEPEKRELRVRKWLVYLTLFVAAIAIITEVVRLVYNFQSGELTTNFFLKILVVLVVAGFTFGYYLWDAKRAVGSVSKMPKILAVVTSALVIGSFALSFFLVGSPSHQRSVRFDNQRVSDLQNIQYQITTYWQNKEILPEKLTDINDSLGGYTTPFDPDTRASYEYAIKGPLTFELCAIFGAVSINDNTIARPYAPIELPNKGIQQDTWSHEAGRACFERTIDPAFYPSNKNIAPTLVPVAVK